MAHPYFHSKSSQRRWGGTVNDYIAAHSFFDHTKMAVPDARHRLILHNAVGIDLATKITARTDRRSIINSDKVEVMLQDLGEQHVTEDFGHIPNVSEVVILISKNMTPKLIHFNLQRVGEFMHKKLGGTQEDYADFEDFFGKFANAALNKAGWSFLCNAFGIFLAEQYIGYTWRRPSDNKILPTRFVAERFVKLGYGNWIPTLNNVVEHTVIEKWMFHNAAALDQQFPDNSEDKTSFENPIVVQAYQQLSLPGLPG